MTIAGKDPSMRGGMTEAHTAAMASLTMVSGLLDVTEQMAMSHETFVESSSKFSRSCRSRSVSSSVSGEDQLF